MADDIGPSFMPTTSLIFRGYAPLDLTRVPKVESEGRQSRLYYELHGSRDSNAKKIVFIMGLNSTCWGWHNQVKYFGNIENGPWSVLVFDNRGVGYSDTPTGPYKTSEMAKDVVDLLDHVGWTKEDRSINVVGVSLGGMISQELGLIIPKRIQSIVLTSTTANLNFRLPSTIALKMYFRLLIGAVKSKRDLVALVLPTLFPQSFLSQKDYYEKGRTNYDYLSEEFLSRMNTGKQSTGMGRFSQMYAGLFHKMTSEKLQVLRRGVPVIGVLTGDDDSLIYWKESEVLKENLGDVEYEVWKDGGHALQSQYREKYHEFIERIVGLGEEKSREML